jgi:hypothetical protein
MTEHHESFARALLSFASALLPSAVIRGGMRYANAYATARESHMGFWLSCFKLKKDLD